MIIFNEMDEKKVFLSIGMVLILILGGVLLYLARPNLTGNVIASGEEVYSQELNVSFSVTDMRMIGINVDTDALSYGRIMRGNIGSRYVTIFNPFNIPVDVELEISENIVDFVSVDYNNFILQVNNDSLNVTVNVEPDETISLGEHNGTLKVVMKKI